MQEGRWTTVTESEFDHERAGLEAIRERLPDAGTWRAWSNFTFTALSGHVREVDLLVVAPGGVYLVELKHWHGSVSSTDGTWVQTTPGGRKIPHGNPLHLANKKAKELASLLAGNGKRVWVGEAVCFTGDGLHLQLPAQDRNGVFTGEQLSELLQRPPRDERRRITPTGSREIESALKRVGIRRSDAQYKVGPYLLQRGVLETGPTWADYLARHTELTQTARVRIYLRERGADAELSRSVEDAARREADILERFQHPGVVRLRQYEPSGHSAGPALVFRYHPDTLRLDQYLATYGDRLDILTRVALVRQLAETVRSAHANRIHHRALAARSIHVIPRHGRVDDAGWLVPDLQISDWQIATQRGPRTSTRFAPTTLSAIHLADDADPYLAPELTARDPDPIALDVYGLGVLTYRLVTDRAPAESQADVLARMERGERGLRPSAVVDGLASDIDELVEAATAFDPSGRLSTVDEFLEMLELVEETLTAPPGTPAVELMKEKDPLEAVTGDVLADRWEVLRRLGTGSTSRAFLVRDLNAAETKGARPLAVLKVALSDGRGEILVREAEVLGRLRAHSGVIRLVEPEPFSLGGRTALALEYVGDEREPTEPGEGRVTSRHRHETVARQLRETGRLQVDQLEAYGDYLFGAVNHLEGEGVWHRDIKPDNIAIRTRPNRTRELVLIDFSLAGYPVRETDIGTDGYLDPFIGSLTRSVYDAQAERYAVAVTLHEMASGELPKWGNGKVPPRQLDPKEWSVPVLATDAFDPAIRDGLVAFFTKALHRDAAQRFPDLRPMQNAWKKIFLDMAEATPTSPRVSRHPAGVAEEEPAADARDRVAAEVTRDTHLSHAGLSPAAESFLYGLGVTTVGELLDYSQRGLVNAPGLGAKTRGEIQRRQREWGARLGRTSPITPEGRRAAAEELQQAAADQGAPEGLGAEAPGRRALRRVSLDALATLLVPAPNRNGTNGNEIELVRLLLHIPDEQGELPASGAWPRQREIARELGLSAGRIPQLLKTQRARWKKLDEVRELREEILEILAGLGRVASAAEVADALAIRRGTRLKGGTARRAIALGAVRAVVEVEPLIAEEAAFRHVVKKDLTEAGLLALEVREGDGPNTPSAPALIDYAERVGKVADRLASLESLPTATTVLGELEVVTPPDGDFTWDERRLVELAAAASRNAAVTPRLEIYARDLDLVRALRISQAGLVRLIPELPEARQPGLTVQEVHERVRTRFPELTGGPLPDGQRLTKALRDAGFDLVMSTREDTGTPRYLPANLDQLTSYLTTGASRRSTRGGSAGRYADDPRQASAALAKEQLEASARRDGFRVLTVRSDLTLDALAALTSEPFEGESVSVTELFLAAMHDLVEPGKRPTWETILRADVAEPGSRGAIKFAEYARTAWGRVEPRLHEVAAMGEGPLLLTDAAVFARYDAMDVLDRLAAAARRGGRGVWLLCPQADPAREPRLGLVAVPYQAGLGEWITLTDLWVRSARRSAEPATGTTR